MIKYCSFTRIKYCLALASLLPIRQPLFHLFFNNTPHGINYKWMSHKNSPFWSNASLKLRLFKCIMKAKKESMHELRENVGLLFAGQFIEDERKIAIVQYYDENVSSNLRNPQEPEGLSSPGNERGPHLDNLTLKSRGRFLGMYENFKFSLAKTYNFSNRYAMGIGQWG